MAKSPVKGNRNRAKKSGKDKFTWNEGDIEIIEQTKTKELQFLFEKIKQIFKKN